MHDGLALRTYYRDVKVGFHGLEIGRAKNPISTGFCDANKIHQRIPFLRVAPFVQGYAASVSMPEAWGSHFSEFVFCHNYIGLELICEFAEHESHLLFVW